MRGLSLVGQACAAFVPVTREMAFSENTVHIKEENDSLHNVGNVHEWWLFVSRKAVFLCPCNKAQGLEKQRALAWEEASNCCSVFAQYCNAVWPQHCSNFFQFLLINPIEEKFFCFFSPVPPWNTANLMQCQPDVAIGVVAAGVWMPPDAFWGQGPRGGFTGCVLLSQEQLVNRFLGCFCNGF